MNLKPLVYPGPLRPRDARRARRGALTHVAAHKHTCTHQRAHSPPRPPGREQSGLTHTDKHTRPSGTVETHMQEPTHPPVHVANTRNPNDCKTRDNSPSHRAPLAPAGLSGRARGRRGGGGRGDVAKHARPARVALAPHFEYAVTMAWLGKGQEVQARGVGRGEARARQHLDSIQRHASGLQLGPTTAPNTPVQLVWEVVHVGPPMQGGHFAWHRLPP